jgi:thiosulfate/3-mercaptopyruvate sulfurtransferase
MIYQTIVSAAELHENLGNPRFVVVDCRFDLSDKPAGYRAYQQGHIPGAVYADLEADLSGPPLTDTGRHPMPGAEALRQTFSRFGIHHGSQVVVYDDAGGAYAARLWWQLGYMGHEAVALLDGGWQAWLEKGFPVQRGVEMNQPAHFEGQPRESWLVLLAELSRHPLLVDARDPARYRGEIEPIDRTPGHIPRAINLPYRRLLDDRGRLLLPEALRRELLALPASPMAPRRSPIVALA